MKRIIFAAVLVLVLALSSGAWAVSPDDALTERPDSPFRLKLRLDNLENVKDIFAHPLMKLYSAKRAYAA